MQNGTYNFFVLQKIPKNNSFLFVVFSKEYGKIKFFQSKKKAPLYLDIGMHVQACLALYHKMYFLREVERVSQVSLFGVSFQNVYEYLQLLGIIYYFSYEYQPMRGIYDLLEYVFQNIGNISKETFLLFDIWVLFQCGRYEDLIGNHEKVNTLLQYIGEKETFFELLPLQDKIQGEVFQYFQTNIQRLVLKREYIL